LIIWSWLVVGAAAQVLAEAAGRVVSALVRGYP
jgi:hypothetical protein